MQEADLWFKKETDEYLQNTVDSSRFTKNMFRGITIVGRIYKVFFAPGILYGAADLALSGAKTEAVVVGGFAVFSALAGHGMDRFGIENMNGSEQMRLDANQELFNRTVERYEQLLAPEAETEVSPAYTNCRMVQPAEVIISDKIDK